MRTESKQYFYDRWPTILGSSLCLAGAAIASLHALTIVIGPGSWTATGTWMILLLATVTGGARVLASSTPGEAKLWRSLWPSCLGTIVAAWVLLGNYGGRSTSFSVAIDWSSVNRFQDRIESARGLIQDGVAPVDPAIPIAAVAVGSTTLAFLLADALAGGLRAPALAGIPLLALWFPGLILFRQLPPLVFIGTVGCLLGALAFDHSHLGPRNRLRGRVARRMAGVRGVAVAATATGVAVAALIVGSASAGVPAVLGTAWVRIFTSPGDGVALSADLDMRRDLSERQSMVLLTYRTMGPDVGPLRVLTLTGFDGTNWRRGADRTGTDFDGDELLWPDPRPAKGEGLQVDFTVEALRDRKLPLPTEPRSVDVSGDWSYDAVRDEVIGSESTRAGTEFSVLAYPRTLTASGLRKAAGPDPLDPAYLQLARTDHASDVRARAVEIVDGATNRYDQAVALQGYLRNAAVFTYSTTVPPAKTDDAVWDFLQQRTGYCVQFATSMTIMARSLGIPARLAVGFLPGTDNGDGLFTVTGRDSHAWPELYFPDYGWVRFEPTPAQQSGSVPSWATPLLSGPTGAFDPSQIPQGRGDQESFDSPVTGASPVEAPVAQDRPATSWWLIAPLAAAVVALLGFTVWLSRRRPVTPDGVEETWQRLQIGLTALGVTWPKSATPRQVPALVDRTLLTRTGGELPEPAHSAMRELAHAVEAERYQRFPEPVTQTQLDRLSAKILGETGQLLANRRERTPS